MAECGALSYSCALCMGEARDSNISGRVAALSQRSTRQRKSPALFRKVFFPLLDAAPSAAESKLPSLLRDVDSISLPFRQPKTFLHEASAALYER